MRTRPSSRSVAVWPSRGGPHRAGRAEVPGGRVVDLRRRLDRPLLPVAPVAAGDEDPSVPEQGGCVLLSAIAHRSRGAELAGRRVVHLGRGVDGVLWRPTAGHEDAAVPEQGRGLQPAADLHRSGLAERAGRRVVQVGGRDARVALAAAADDEDPTVLQQGGRVLVADRAHRAGLAERAGCRVVDLGRLEHVRRRLHEPERSQGHAGRPARARTGDAAGDQHATVGQKRGGVVLARRVHRTGRAERAGRRVVQLGRGTDAGVCIATAGPAREQDAAILQPRRGRTGARRPSWSRSA